MLNLTHLYACTCHKALKQECMMLSSFFRSPIHNFMRSRLCFGMRFGLELVNCGHTFTSPKECSIGCTVINTCEYLYELMYLCIWHMAGVGLCVCVVVNCMSVNFFILAKILQFHLLPNLAPGFWVILQYTMLLVL